MKLTISGVLIISFLAMAVFGTMAMGHGQMHNRVICLASVMQAGNCPNDFNPISYFGFHLNAFNTFFTAVFGSGLDGVLASLAALFLAAGFVFALRRRPDSSGLIFKQEQRKFAELFIYPFSRPETSWRALHENSPSAAPASLRLSAIR